MPPAPCPARAARGAAPSSTAAPLPARPCPSPEQRSTIHATRPARTSIAQASAGQPIRVVICGSLYLAGHVLARQEGVTPEPN